MTRAPGAQAARDAAPSAAPVGPALRAPEPARAFAVVIPSRDGLPDLLEAVRSALSQSLAPREVVVVDDGSRDGTAAALHDAFAEPIARGVLRVLSGRFGRASAARNAGWRATTAPWIAFLDADDVWFEDKLETADRALSAAPGAEWFFSDGAFRDEDGRWVDSWLGTWADLEEPWIGQPVEELFEVNFILTSSMVVRRDALESLGGFDERLTHAEDVGLWIALARRAPGTASRRALVRYQHRPGGLTRQLERRLLGDVSLFGALAIDRTLSPRLRRCARLRVSAARLKLGLQALREGRTAEARAELRHAWIFPGRAVPVAAAWAASLLPRPWLDRLRRQSWMMHPVGSRLTRPHRVALRAAGSRSLS